MANRDYEKEAILRAKFDEMLEEVIPNFKRIMTRKEYTELFCDYLNAQASREAAEKDMERGAIESAQKNTNRANHWEDLIREGLKPIKNRANAPVGSLERRKPFQR